MLMIHKIEIFTFYLMEVLTRYQKRPGLKIIKINLLLQEAVNRSMNIKQPANPKHSCERVLKSIG